MWFLRVTGSLVCNRKGGALSTFLQPNLQTSTQSLLPPFLGVAGNRTAPWFALYTRSRFEKQVADQLERKRVPVFLPLRQEVHRWQDRYQKVDVPFFRGYLFAQFEPDSHERVFVLRTNGVVRILGFGSEYTVVPPEQIEALRRLAEERAALHPHRFLRIGQRVKVATGSLAGVEGILVRIRKQDRLVIAVEAIRQAVAVELAGYEVIPL